MRQYYYCTSCGFTHEAYRHSPGSPFHERSMTMTDASQEQQPLTLAEVKQYLSWYDDEDMAVTRLAQALITSQTALEQISTMPRNGREVVDVIWAMRQIARAARLPKGGVS